MRDAPERKRPVPQRVPRRARLLGGAAFLTTLLAPVILPAPAMAQQGGMSTLRPDQMGSTALPGLGTSDRTGVPGFGTPGATPAAPAAGVFGSGRGAAGVDRNAPVTFTANEVEYDQNTNVVTATGAVEAWQNERILRADRFTYNRNTGVATVEGNVQLLEPDGQVLFAERAELMGGMRDTVVEGLRGLLAQNGRLAANGARRRTVEGGAVVMDLSRVVYSACNLCEENPEAAPLWQLRSRLATQDGEDKRIRFRDALVEFDGIPTLYTPYLSMPDPSTPRSSGFLTPSFGQTRYLGAFAEIPYYWAIDDASDLTVTPLISTEAPPSIFGTYRRRFNFGQLNVLGSLGQLTAREGSTEKGLGYSLFARGAFTIDENWTAGFNINRATSETYLRAYRQPATSVLSSNIYTEGYWGYDTFARVNAMAFQSLLPYDVTSRIPFVLPNLYYETVLNRDSWGGTLTADATAFNIYREEGTRTRRAGTRFRYELPFQDSMGAQWAFRTQVDALAYNASNMNLPPNNNTSIDSVTTATANIRAAIDWRLPLIRSAGSLGQQLIEPRIQLVTGPNTGRQTRIPNEDSLDFEFTDANLFELNRFNGRDRQEGGTRVDAALRSAWYFPNGGTLEGLVGRSFRASKEDVFEERSGLDKRASDWVGRVTMAPTPWLDLTARGRFDGDTLDRRMIDTSASFGLSPLGIEGTRISTGYFYQVPSALRTPPSYIREVYGSVSTRITPQWRASVFGRYDLENRRGVAVGASAAYEDECFLFEGRFYRTLAENPSTNELYPGGTTLFFRIALKTVGEFGLRAL
jgi:LPS-assembly protein